MALPKNFQYIAFQMTFLFEQGKPWRSLEEGVECCIGPRGKLLCFGQTPQYFATHSWQHSIHVRV